MDESIGDTNFLDWLPARRFKRAGASLAELSGERMGTPDNFSSYVTDTAEAAWSVPVSRLTCEQVRLLVSQKFGLKWLARPVAEFVHLRPRAEITFFPGDLTMAALRAFGEIASHDRQAAILIRDADLWWMTEIGFGRAHAREAAALIEAARAARL